MTNSNGRTRPAPPPDLLAGSSLFLDFDGTLVEIAERPDAVIVDERLRPLLARLIARLDGRLAIISGRPVAEVAVMLSDMPLAIAGSHGMEFRWPDGRSAPVERPDALADALAAMRDYQRRTPGTLVEDKPLGVALHYRGAPAAEAEARALGAMLADRHGLHLQPGKMLVEVRAAGGDKGAALGAFMQEPEMAGTYPVFAGDDTTDEPAFVTANMLGGAGILIGEDRDSAAAYRLPGVPDMLAWLEQASGGAA